MNDHNSIMPENYEEFTSMTMKTRNLKKPIKNADCEWKNLYQDIMRTISQEEGTIH